MVQCLGIILLVGKCGPQSFLSQITAALIAIGVRDRQQLAESFPRRGVMAAIRFSPAQNHQRLKRLLFPMLWAEIGQCLGSLARRFVRQTHLVVQSGQPKLCLSYPTQRIVALG